MTRFCNLNLDIELNLSDRKTDDIDLDWLTDKDQDWLTDKDQDWLSERHTHTHWQSDRL